MFFGVSAENININKLCVLCNFAVNISFVRITIGQEMLSA